MDVLSSDDLVPRPIRSALRRSYWPLLSAAAGNRPYMQLVKQVLHLDGNLIKCGVVRGKTLLRTAAYVNLITPEKTLFGLTHFESNQQPGIASAGLAPGEKIRRFLARLTIRMSAYQSIIPVASDLRANLKLYRGYFEETLPRFDAEQFCFVHLDCDVYDSYRLCLESLYDKVVPGGIILLDNYRSSEWPGATKAVGEFFAGRAELPQRCDDPDLPEEPKYYVVKQESSAVANAA